MGKINLITHQAEFCSGFCAYCQARIDDLISQGFNLNDVEKSLRDINKKNYETAKFDFAALEKKFETHPMMKDKQGSVTLWGADPLGCFDCLQEEVDFIEYLNREKGYHLGMGLCTNGLGFMIPEWVEFLVKHHIGISFSHDLLGQEIRTIKKEFDPMFFDGFDELCRTGQLGLISPVLNQYNSDPVANYHYFEDMVLSKYPKVQLRLSKSKNGHYDIKTANRTGICNGKYYEELKDKPYGDMLIHNDLSNPLLAHQLDIYIDGWKEIYSNPQKYQNCWRQAVKFARLNNGNKPKNPCYNFQHGITETSYTIDTLGKDCECMLMDSRAHAQYPGMSDICKDCKYKGRYECKECDVMEPVHADPTALHQCKFNYRYQELMDFANAKIDYYELQMRMRNGNQLRQNHNVSRNGNGRSQQTKNRLCSSQSNQRIQRKCQCSTGRTDKPKEQP